MIFGTILYPSTTLAMYVLYFGIVVKSSGRSTFCMSSQAIACRQDLAIDEEQRYPFGAIDAKVSSVRLASGQNDLSGKSKQTQQRKKKDPIVLLKMGPTTGNHQPPFCWSQVFFYFYG